MSIDELQKSIVKRLFTDAQYGGIPVDQAELIVKEEFNYFEMCNEVGDKNNQEEE